MMIRRLNTLASSTKAAAEPAAVLKSISHVTGGAEETGAQGGEQGTQNVQEGQRQEQRQYNSPNGQRRNTGNDGNPMKRINGRFRLFLQPFEVTALVKNRGEVVRQLKTQHNLYNLNLSPFVNAAASRSLRIRIASAANTSDARKGAKKDRLERATEEADRVSVAIADMYREIIERRSQRDSDGFPLKAGSGQLRFAVTNSMAAKFDVLCQELFRNGGQESISVNKELIPDARDQLLLVNVKKLEDLDQVARFIHKMVLLEWQTRVNLDTDLPRAHILPRSEINYHSHTTMGQRGQYSKIRLIIPDYMVGTVIGRGGQNIRGLREDSGAFISLKNDNNDPAKPPVVQIVAQDKESVDKAIVGLKQVLEQEWYSDKSLEDIEKIFLRAGYNV